MPEISAEHILEIMECSGQDVDAFLENSCATLVDSRTGKARVPGAVFRIDAKHYFAKCSLKQTVGLRDARRQRRINARAATHDRPRPFGCHPGPAPLKERDENHVLSPLQLFSKSRMQARANRVACLCRYNIAASQRIWSQAVETQLEYAQSHADDKQIVAFAAKHKHVNPRSCMCAGQLAAMAQRAASNGQQPDELINISKGLFFAWLTEAAAVIERNMSTAAAPKHQLQLHVGDGTGWPALVRIENPKSQTPKVPTPCLARRRTCLHMVIPVCDSF